MNIGEALKVNAGTIYVEGANPRHEHEWRVFQDVDLPGVAWLELKSLADGAAIAPAELERQLRA